MRRSLLLAAGLALLGSSALATPQSKKDRKGAKKADQKPASISWITDFEAGLKLAKRTGRPILVDFWCGT